MKNKLLFVSIIIAIFSQLLSVAQETIKMGKQEGKYYVVRDTIDGKPWTHYYSSESSYLKTQRQKMDEIEKLREQKRIYESNQRTYLADAIKEINSRVDKIAGYSEDMAENDKIETAKTYAERIQKHNSMIDSQIEFYKVKTTYQASENSSNGIEIKNDGGFEVKFGRKGKGNIKEVGTTSFFSLGFGYNFMDGQNLGIDDFSYANNNYFSMGFLWQTPLNKRQTVRVNYGITYQTHGTELNGGRAFSTTPDQTTIENLGFQPAKAKFRQDQFVVPVQLEFGGTRKKEYEDGRVRYEQWDKFKAGIGGFAGFNTSSRLKMKFEDSNNDIKKTTINAFDNETFVYGLDAYVGVDNYVLFGRMNLNDVFKSGSVDAQYVTFGIRLQ